LIAACASPNPTVRVRAVWCLGLAKDPAAYETILALTDDPDEQVRYDAVLALGKLGDPRAIEPLYRIALGYDVTRPAFEAIWQFGFTALEAVEGLYKLGKELTRHAAVNCAGGMAEMEHCHERCVALLRAACNDPVGSIRSDAHYWLKELGIEP
ncbi:MAG TPA: HEAT repeat domain-containing protein, partial [Fimbriimonadaceae bacterium]|nr:HEAT repeat domain-containing protein [Fimbriimonadaceae bacterium]